MPAFTGLIGRPDRLRGAFMKHPCSGSVNQFLAGRVFCGKERVNVGAFADALSLTWDKSEKWVLGWQSYFAWI